MLTTLFGLVKKILERARSSFRNFIVFTLTLAATNLCVRFCLYTNLHGHDKALQIITILFFIVSLSTCLSLLRFLLTVTYKREVESFVSKFIDLERIRKNRENWEYIEMEAERQFPEVFPKISLKLKYGAVLLWIAFIILSRWPFKNDGIKLTWLILFCTACVVYLIFVRLCRLTIIHVRVPPERELIPSQLRRKKWELEHILKTTDLLGFLAQLWHGETRQQAPPPTIKEVNLKNAGLRGTYLRLGVVTAATGLFFASITGAFTAETTVYDSYSQRPPSTRFLGPRIDGYYTTSKTVYDRANELNIQGCDMSTFYHPTTKELDSAAVCRAYNYYEDSRSDRKIMGVDIPYPTGPFESARQIAATPSVDDKEIPDLS